MQKKILVSVDDYETRVAILENAQLAEYFFERTNQHRRVGNIYKGRVTAIVDGIEAAFVDIGMGRNAFLFVSDIYPVVNDDFPSMLEEEDEKDVEDETQTDRFRIPAVSIREILQEGQEILVQMEKEPIGGKGPRVTTGISIPGKYLVLLPTTRHVGVSRRIECPQERLRLRHVAEQLCPNGMGIIARTAAEGLSLKDFQFDLETLSALWKRINKRTNSARAPSLIHKDLGLTFRMVRDVLTEEVTDLIVDQTDVYQSLREYTETIMPELTSRIKLWDKSTPLFVAEGIEAEISGLMNKKVWLGCGGYLVIEETEALTVIDVNSGRYLGSRNLEDTVFVTNLEAAAEIARQLRLRDIGGIAIIDFIDMEKKKNRELVFSKLQESLKGDRSKTRVYEITELGLVQMTRKRVRKSLNRLLTQPCPYCKREGSILSLKTMAIKVFRRLVDLCQETALKEVALYVHPELAEHIALECSEQIDALEKKFHKDIRILPAKPLPFDRRRTWNSSSKERI